jgi:glycosyltransferase involved in cell wall biosynthesis
MKIAIVIDDLGMGGAQRVVYELIKHFDSSKYNATIICTEDRRYSLLEQQVIQEGYAVVFLKRHRWEKYFKYIKIFELYQILHKLKPNIIHAHQRGILAAFWALFNRVFIIVTVHTNPAYTFLWWFEHLFFKLSLFFRRVIVVAISKYNLNLIKPYWHLDDRYARFVNNGIDISQYYSKPHKTFAFINVSRQDVNKNQSLILRAFAHLYNENKQIPMKVYLVGSGKTHEILKQQAKVLDVQKIVEFTGYIPNIKDYLAISDVYISASHREGLPLSVLEAMASHLPIIATDAGGVRDLAQENGILIADNDEYALYSAMKELRDNGDLRVAKKEKSYEMVQAYSAKIMAEAYCSIYEEFVS